MKISRKKHEAGFTECDFNDKGKCLNPIHWETKTEWHIPDVIVHLLMERMQRDQFTAPDLARSLSEFLAKEGQKLHPGMDAEIIKEAMRTVKRRGIVAEVETDRGAVETFKWIGKTGGIF